MTAGIVAGSLFWLASSLAYAQCTGCPKPSFGPAARAFRAGAGSFYSATVADLVGNGETDIILTTDQYGVGPSVTILRQTEPGEFSSPVSYPLPSLALGVVVGDFTDDGIPDIVGSGSEFSPGLYLLRGMADGGFDSAQNVFPTAATRLLVSGDFNGDGRLDVAGSTSNSVWFFSGNGNGGFLGPIDVPAGPGIASLTSADLNEDGRSDLIATNQGSNTVSVILGVAAPPFAPATNFIVGSGPFSAAASDFNSDGKMDLAVSSFGNNLSTLMGTGTGSFLPPAHLAVDPGLVVVGDFQGDGKMDIAVIAHNSSQYQLWELSGNGAGAFAVERHTGWRGTPLAADFTRDGVTDLAVVSAAATFFSPAEVNAFLIAGSSEGLKAPPATVTDNFGIGALASADFSGDGVRDVAYSSQGGIRVALGTGQGTFVNGQVLSSLFNIVAIETADVNADGAHDLLALQYDRLNVLLGNGTGQFGAPTVHAVGSNATDLSLGDLNGDGRPDVAVSNGGSNSISVLLGMASGAFQSQGKYAVGHDPRGIVIAPFDGDAYPDVAVITFDAVAILLSNGTGAFRSIETFPLGPNLGAPRSPVVADFSGDGNMDLAVLVGQNYSTTSGIALMRGTGTGQIAAPTIISVSGAPSQLETADFNQDSRPDFFVAGPATGSVLVNTGTSFADPVAYWIGEPSHFAVIGDFVSNGLPDVAVSSGGSRAIVVLPNTNCRVTSLKATGPTGCFAAGQPFPGQPVVEVRDDGGNRITCDTGIITASIVTGTGAVGAVLLGNASVSAVAGTATFTNLAVDRAGSGYRLQLNHPVAGATRSRAFSTTDTTMTAPGSVCPYATGQIASVADAGLGATYTWTITNGQITAGEGTRSITFRAGPFGETTLQVLVQRTDCQYTVTRSVSINSAGCPAPVGFFTVFPCRLLDTRDLPPGPFGAPSLSAGEARSVSVLNRCGLPATAKALSLNVTVTEPLAPGYVTIFPGGTPVPPTSTVNYVPGQTRANNAIIPVGAAGDLTAFCGQMTGTVHVILDVNGYFE